MRWQAIGLAACPACRNRPGHCRRITDNWRFFRHRPYTHTDTRLDNCAGGQAVIQPRQHMPETESLDGQNQTDSRQDTLGRVLWRRKSVLCASLILAAAAGIAYLLLATPLYTSHA